MKKLLVDAFNLINRKSKFQIYLIIFFTIFISFIETIGLGLLTLLISILNDSSLFFSKLEKDHFNYFLPFFDDENYITNSKALYHFYFFIFLVELECDYKVKYLIIFTKNIFIKIIIFF